MENLSSGRQIKEDPSSLDSNKKNPKKGRGVEFAKINVLFPYTIAFNGQI